jgi:hypothetical protein
VLVFAITYLPWIYNIYSVYGFFGLDAQANSLQMFQNIPEQLSLFVVILIFFILHLVYLWYIGVIVKLLNTLLYNKMVIAVCSFCIGSIPILLFFKS